MQGWKEVVADFVDVDAFEANVHAIVPWDERFQDRRLLASALEVAGLRRVVVHERAYDVSVGVEDWVRMREGSVEGTLLRRELEAQQWQSLQRELRARLHARFDPAIMYTRSVLLACGDVP
jgi:hypothetical protein